MNGVVRGGWAVEGRKSVKAAYTGTFQIPYTSQDFPAGTVAGGGILGADWGGLLWGALTVGRPNRAYVLGHSDASYYEALFRLSLVQMALEERPLSEGLYRTEAFRTLDPTEKGAVSYFLGMAVCKLFADRLLNATWLFHLDVFREQLDPVVLGGRSRPDLVGCDQAGAWHAFECKGRSSVPNGDERQNAKAQAQRLVRVGSTDCSLHVGAISYFRQDMLEFHWRDPEPERAEKLEPLAVDLPKDAWGHYYAPALAMHNAAGSEEMSDSLAAADLKVEIYPGVRERLLAGEWEEAQSLALKYGRVLRERGFRRDGLKVTAGKSWARQRERARIDL